MIARLKLLWSHAYVQRLKVELVRFGVTGLANAALTFVIFFSLLKLLKVGYLLALLVSWACGMVFSYCCNFLWVFEQRGRLSFDHRFRKFASIGILSISFNLMALQLLVHYTGVDPFWLQTALIPPVVVFNFVTAKFWSFNAFAGKRASDDRG